jgi:hypothetical protein
MPATVSGARGRAAVASKHREAVNPLPWPRRGAAGNGLGESILLWGLSS